MTAPHPILPRRCSVAKSIMRLRLFYVVRDLFGAVQSSLRNHKARSIEPERKQRHRHGRDPQRTATEGLLPGAGVSDAHDFFSPVCSPPPASASLEGTILPSSILDAASFATALPDRPCRSASCCAAS